MGRGSLAIPAARQGQRHGAGRGLNKGHDKRDAHGRRLAAVAATVSEGLGDWRYEVVHNQKRLDADLVELARACLTDAPGGVLALAAAGSKLQEQVRAASLRGDDGMVVNTSRYIRSRWGGWEGFARFAPTVLSVSGESVRLVAAAILSDDMHSDAPARVPRSYAAMEDASEHVSEMPTALSSLVLDGGAAGGSHAAAPDANALAPLLAGAKASDAVLS